MIFTNDFKKDLGGYSVGVPPLPIPIRQLADRREGRRQLILTPDSKLSPGVFIDTLFFIPLQKKNIKFIQFQTSQYLNLTFQTFAGH